MRRGEEGRRGARGLRAETLTLLLITAAVGYLFYYVLSTRGGYFASISVTMLATHVVFEWARLFYKVGRAS